MSVDLAAQVAHQRELVISGATRSLSWRLEQLKTLETALRRSEDTILRALAADLRKPTVEAYLEISTLYQEIRLLRRNLRTWLKPQVVEVPLVFRPAKAKVTAEPLGCVLIIGAWNYPLLLLLAPLVAALGAGNTAILKPSEHAPHTAALLAGLMERHFASHVVAVVQGGPEAAQALLAQRFDHIFFTGGTPIGRLVMQQAARRLTPVTLELGGKNPCLVAADANIPLAARRIAWGRFLNAGQTCVAPDYVLVAMEVRDRFLREMRLAIQTFYGLNPQNSPDYGRVVNQQHFQRLAALLDGRTVACGGQLDADDRYIAPTLVEVESWNDPLLDEELFGPILPLLPLDDLETAIAAINSRPKPLALYLFSSRQDLHEQLLNRTSSGTVCFNDVVIQSAMATLPFGGVGESGIGAYHGRAGFERFSHRRSVLTRQQHCDLPWRYPPYGNRVPWIKRFLG